MSHQEHEKAMRDLENSKKELNDLLVGIQNGKYESKTGDSSAAKRENAMKCLYFFQFVWIVVFAIVLNSDGDCEQPIRLWIKVLMCAFAANVAIAILGSSFSLPKGFIFLQALIHLFEFIWYIIGTVWFFKDDTCETNWYSGYIVSLILVIFFFISLIPYLCVCCVVSAAVAVAVKKD
jgi:hypothetical protein